MGSILDCACVHCEYYQDGILLGPDIAEGSYYFPALQADRRKIIQVDISRYLEIDACPTTRNNNEELLRFRSEKKLLYFLDEMFEWNGCENEILSEFPHLQSKFNFCPQCEKFGLQFQVWEPFEQ